MNDRFEYLRAVMPLLTTTDRHYLHSRLRIPMPTFGPGVAAARASKQPMRRKEMQPNSK
jgi:hypothetical protein